MDIYTDGYKWRKALNNTRKEFKRYEGVNNAYNHHHILKTTKQL